MTDATDAADLRGEILGIKDWRHPFEIEPGVWVELLKDWFKEWHEWRVRVLMPNIETLVELCVPGGMANTRVLDLGCWDGFYGFEFVKRGALYLKGIDLREENLRQANLITRHFGYDNCDFELINVQDMKSRPGTFDVSLCNGILYHLSAPVEVLKAVGDATRSIIVISTYVTGDDDPDLRLKTENSSAASTGHQDLVTVPSEAALLQMLKWAGFATVLRDIPYPFYERYKGKSFGFYYALKGVDTNTLERIASNLAVRDSYDPKLLESQVVDVHAAMAVPRHRSLREKVAGRLHGAIDKVL